MWFQFSRFLVKLLSNLHRHIFLPRLGMTITSKRIKTCDNSDVAPCEVCKSWRLLALPNKKRFMASKPPMLMRISTRASNKKRFCLEDFEGGKFKTTLPHSCGRVYLGLTCGYFIMFGRDTKDFCLVNPITRHGLHFPPVPTPYCESRISAILVFSSVISKWVFVILYRFDCLIWFCIAGEGAWNHVCHTSPIIDIHSFKGKIYTIDYDYNSGRGEARHLCEMRLNPEPKLMLLETKNFPKEDLILPKFVSSDENLYLTESFPNNSWKVFELDFGKMKWVPFEETGDEYTFFFNGFKHGAAVKLESKDGRYDDLDESGNGRFIGRNMWYFPHECLNVNLLHE
ncbi:unnamed protein product [Lactuca virosa]|uniref:KIB1-4 beta-propeller domain-containing protein n=1 Tax=Lactuca virosa TaxID=75947 RepID=A0AAU9MQB8_9ASTR|nr:unnamed protein product [Lactuca virosa]